jgi:hypothetical protein
MKKFQQKKKMFLQNFGKCFIFCVISYARASTRVLGASTQKFARVRASTPKAKQVIQEKQLQTIANLIKELEKKELENNTLKDRHFPN